MDLIALKALIDATPDAKAKADSGDDTGCAAVLNALPAVIDRTEIPSHEVFEAVVPAEWSAITAAEKQRVQTILGMGTVNFGGPNTRAALGSAFGAGTTTRANLLALQSRAGSIPERDFGRDVTANDVSAAMLPSRPNGKVSVDG